MRIAAAAFLCQGLVYALPAPARHVDVWRMMAATGVPLEEIEAAEQGFVTDEEPARFLRRVPAFNVARAAGQLLHPPGLCERQLYSEDVW